VEIPVAASPTVMEALPIDSLSLGMKLALKAPPGWCTDWKSEILKLVTFLVEREFSSTPLNSRRSPTIKSPLTSYAVIAAPAETL